MQYLSSGIEDFSYTTGEGPKVYDEVRWVRDRNPLAPGSVGRVTGFFGNRSDMVEVKWEGVSRVFTVPVSDLALEKRGGDFVAGAAVGLGLNLVLLGGGIWLLVRLTRR